MITQAPALVKENQLARLWGGLFAIGRPWGRDVAHRIVLSVSCGLLFAAVAAGIDFLIYGIRSSDPVVGVRTARDFFGAVVLGPIFETLLLCLAIWVLKTCRVNSAAVAAISIASAVLLHFLVDWRWGLGVLPLFTILVVTFVYAYRSSWVGVGTAIFIHGVHNLIFMSLAFAFIGLGK